jgi:hypothetical protein
MIASIRPAPVMRVTDERFEPARFRLQNRAAQRLQTVVAPSIVRAAAVSDQTERGQAGDRRVECAGTEAHVAAGAVLDVLDDAVAVALAVGQREQDVELLSRERQEAECVLSHASNLDVSSLDVTTPAKVGSALDGCGMTR